VVREEECNEIVKTNPHQIADDMKEMILQIIAKISNDIFLFEQILQ